MPDLSYFQNWGSLQNPIRQSDLNSLFESMFGCAKKFAMSKIYPMGNFPKMGYELVLGNVVHEAIANFLQHDTVENVRKILKKWEDRNNTKVNFYREEKEAILNEYQQMLVEVLPAPEMKSIRRRLVDVERAFIIPINGIHVAGTIDLIIKGKTKGTLAIIDWKTGKTIPSQFAMNHGYQSNIYAYAVEKGEFFLKPDLLGDNTSYYKAYQKTQQKNSYGVYPSFFFAFLRDLLLSKKKSKRQTRHVSTEKLADKNGYIHTEQNERKGPVFYETMVSKSNLNRLSYTLKCAIAFAKSGLFPERVGSHCEKCIYREKCLLLGTVMDGQQEIEDMMEELGIEGD